MDIDDIKQDKFLRFCCGMAGGAVSGVVINLAGIAFATASRVQSWPNEGMLVALFTANVCAAGAAAHAGRNVGGEIPSLLGAVGGAIISINHSLDFMNSL